MERGRVNCSSQYFIKIGDIILRNALGVAAVQTDDIRRILEGHKLFRIQSKNGFKLQPFQSVRTFR
jgi:hypothetical protein